MSTYIKLLSLRKYFTSSTIWQSSWMHLSSSLIPCCHHSPNAWIHLPFWYLLLRREFTNIISILHSVVGPTQKYCELLFPIDHRSGLGYNCSIQFLCYKQYCSVLANDVCRIGKDGFCSHCFFILMLTNIICFAFAVRKQETCKFCHRRKL